MHLAGMGDGRSVPVEADADKEERKHSEVTLRSMAHVKTWRCAGSFTSECVKSSR